MPASLSQHWVQSDLNLCGPVHVATVSANSNVHFLLCLESAVSLEAFKSSGFLHIS